MAKITQKYKNIDEYITDFPKEVQEILKGIRKTIQNAVPEATESINYHMPTFRLNGESIVHFAAWKNHIGVYGIAETEPFIKEISKYVTPKGTLQFPINQPIPYDLLKKIIKFRTKETVKSII